MSESELLKPMTDSREIDPKATPLCRMCFTQIRHRIPCTVDQTRNSDVSYQVP